MMNYAYKTRLDDLQMIRQGYHDHFAKEPNLTNIATLLNRPAANEQPQKGTAFSLGKFGTFASRPANLTAAPAPQKTQEASTAPTPSPISTTLGG